MFGTLVICLPAEHQGGDVILTHGDQSLKFCTSACQPSYLCWYADVRHEITEVKKGYRMVLTYNLIKSGPESANDLHNAKLPAANPLLSDALHKWTQLQASANDVTQRNSPAWDTHHVPQDLVWHSELIYVLAHEYSESSLALANLKAADLERTQALERLGHELGFTVFLATTERFVHSSEDETFSDCVELRKVFDLEGNELLANWPTGEKCFLQEDTFDDDREPDDEEHEGYTGNAGNEDRFWYRNTVRICKL